MKKIFSMAAIALFMMTASCSSDDSNETVNPENGLLKKMVITYEDGSIETDEFTYEGNKLTQITFGDGTYTKFLYNNDLLTESQMYGTDNLIEFKNVYEYNDDNKLITDTEIHSGEGSYNKKTTFTYNSDSTITAMVYMGEGEEELHSTCIITLTNNNITQVHTEMAQGAVEWTMSFAYDDKNNPLKNIPAFDIITLTDFYIGGGVNNLLSQSYESEVVYTCQYQYNSNGYPSSMIDQDDIEQTTTQFIYE